MRKNKKEVKDEIKEDAIEEVEEKDLEQNSSDEVEKKLNSEIEELKNQLLRLQADFVNYKNRTEREKCRPPNLRFPFPPGELCDPGGLECSGRDAGETGTSL